MHIIHLYTVTFHYTHVQYIRIIPTNGVPRQHSKCCAHSESHNEGDVLDGIDLHSSCIWIQTEVVREVEAKETAQVEHLCVR